MFTLGDKTKNTSILQESWSLNLSFVSDAVMPVGALVKLVPATGHVDVAAAGDCFGICSVGAKAIGDKVTVQTQFVAKMVGEASAAITKGDVLVAGGLNATGDLQKYTAAAAGNTVVAIALTDAAAAGDEVEVGILRVFTTL